MQKTILKTTDLAIGYQTNKATEKIIQEKVNIQLKIGTLTALLGINGIGKSTLLKALYSGNHILKGNVLLEEKSISKYSTQERAKYISIVLTEKIPYSNLSVKELLKIGRTPYTNWSTHLTSEDWFWIDKAITLTNIEDLISYKVSQLSDGQLQRILIARAIAQNTPVIILDEPTNHLDLNHKVSLFKLLKKLAEEEDKAILFSSHDMDLSLQLSDEIIVLKSNFNIQGKSDTLIKKGIFDCFFNDNNLFFDRDQRRFIVK